jgi:hypothetical protein
MPFYCGKRSVGICVVLGPKKSSTYSSKYASGFFEPAASHLPASRLPRDEGLLGQAPCKMLKKPACLFGLSGLFGPSRSPDKRNQIDRIDQTDQIDPKSGFAVASHVFPIVY